MPNSKWLLLLLLLLPSPLLGATVEPEGWSEDFHLLGTPNTIRLWSNRSFLKVEGKDQFFSDDRTYVEFDPIGSQFTIWWNNPRRTVRMDWQELVVDSSGRVIEHWETGYQIRKNDILERDFGKAGGISAVPEPPLWLLILLGIVFLYLRSYGVSTKLQ